MITVKDQKRFWNRVNKKGRLSSELGRCWEYCPPSNLTFQFWFRGRMVTVTRFAYELQVGKIPGGLIVTNRRTALCVLHKCDNPLCVNPKHLFLGTQNDNMQDKVNKHRQAKGEIQHLAKLTAETVTEIRRRYKPGCRINGQCAMAREFKVSQSTIREVIMKYTWRHL